MAENDPDDRGSASKLLGRWMLRLFLPLPGALTGATLGFQVYFRQPGLNTDSAAPLILAGLWAFGGLLSGVLFSSLAVWLIQGSLRRLFSIGPLFTTGLTLFCLIGLCMGLYAPLEALLPSVLWPIHQKGTPQAPPRSQCAQTPPSSPNERKAWELECN